MFKSSMSVAQRVSVLRQIFKDFGIPVVEGSILDRTIRNEFGPGKRSKINQLIRDYSQQTDAAYLSVCIGAELRREFADPELSALGDLMCERLPSVLEIADIRQQTERRELALQGILTHIRSKLPTDGSEYLQRTLVAAEEQLHDKLQAQMFTSIVEHSGTVFACGELQKAGVILRAVVPALLSLENPNLHPSQSINLVVNAMRIMALELKQTKLTCAANIIDYIHWLAQLHLPKLQVSCSVEDILTNLEIPFAKSTARLLRDKSRKVGLYDEELLQIVHSNQRYAATCGIIAKLAKDIDCPPLEKIAVSGLCLITLKQSYAELKTGNLQAVNFSEASGILLSNLGSLTNNGFLSKLGTAVTNGVKTYTGLLAAPGGASVALPLAICTALGKLLLKNKQRNIPPSNTTVDKTLHEIVLLQKVIQWHFAELHRKIELQHHELLAKLQHGFASIIEFVAHWQQFDQRNWQQLLNIEYSIHLEFSDLYIEYIRDPLEQFDYANTYNDQASLSVPDVKFKLQMWLLYKAKHPKANGRTLCDEAILRVTQPDPILGLLNKYANQQFSVSLPEDLPHMPTWLLAATALADLLDSNMVVPESKILHGILEQGEIVSTYIADLRHNTVLFNNINLAIQQLQHREADIMQQLAPPAELPVLCKIAQPAPWERQLERFTAVGWDLTSLWDNYAIPDEYSIATYYQIGSIRAEYTVLQSNTFTEVHISYTAINMPLHAQQVKMKVDIIFDYQSRNYVLATSVHVYYLPSAAARFEQYYRQKFQYPLKHTNFDWISMDGCKNQVTGHPVTTCNKVIDYTKLGLLYQRWFSTADVLHTDLQAHPDLFTEIQREIQAKRLQAQTTSAMARSTHAELASVQHKLAVYRALESSFYKIVEGSLASELGVVLGRLRLLLPESNDIMPALGLE